MAETSFKLNTGASIPALGLGTQGRQRSCFPASLAIGGDANTHAGTWQSASGEVKNAVSHALNVGYRHIDCAYVYGNEDEVGEGLAEAFRSGKIKRRDVFVTTKLWCTYHSRVEENLDLSLKGLGLDYVDLYLMHWPCPMNPKGVKHLPSLEDNAANLRFYRRRSEVPQTRRRLSRPR